VHWPSRKSRVPSPQIAKRIAAYGAVAGAVAACASSAQAEVVYTPTHAKIGYDYPIDLNHDGINDFRIHSYELSGDGSAMAYPLHQGNRIAATFQPCGAETVAAAAALPQGAVIGPQMKFEAKANCMIVSLSSTVNGPWLFAQNRYLGLVFVIDGKEHFGWARLTNGEYEDSTVILGYAYETIPNKPIRAGDQGNSTEISAAPGSLGALAVGATASKVRQAMRTDEEGK
jgi:hypothetical protein